MKIVGPKRSPLSALIGAAQERQAEVAASLTSRRTDLPLRYWRQQAHFTTPAADEGMARKAIESGTAPMARLLERFTVTPERLADHLEVDPAVIERLLAEPVRAPLVMLDGEDAQALREDVRQAGLAAAARLLRTGDWSGGGPPTLRFFRPSGFDLETTVVDLYTLLDSLAGDTEGQPLPLDGIVFPKVEHPEEVDLLYEVLDRAEAGLGLPAGVIRVAFLVESAWAVVQLPEIARRAADRLCALIFGIADYSADLGLPRIADDHPVADWARAQVVDVAAAVGVPAIDAMTLAYPVRDPALDESDNRSRFLERVKLVYADAVRGRDFGMQGKWVGHPAQLFATLLAYEQAYSPEVLESEAATIEAYRTSVEEEAKGATIIGGVMSDRATDRHARARLRRAVAVGRFDPERAARLGIVTRDELEPPARSRGGEAS